MMLTLLLLWLQQVQRQPSLPFARVLQILVLHQHFLLQIQTQWNLIDGGALSGYSIGHQQDLESKKMSGFG
jgi:hypothetical protein